MMAEWNAESGGLRLSRRRQEDGFARATLMPEARRSAPLPGWVGVRLAPSPPHPQPPRRGPFKRGRDALWRRSGARGRSRSRIPEPEPERSGAGAERAERAEPAAELGARAGGMYRARAARAGPEPGSPGRFGILSTGQLRDLLQDEPKLDRIVRLSRKVVRGVRAGGTGVGLRPAGPAERPKGLTDRAAGPPVGAGAWHVRVGPAEPPPGVGAPGAGLGRVGRQRPREAPVHPWDGREACPTADAPGRCVPGGRVAVLWGALHPRSVGPERGGAFHREN